MLRMTNEEWEKLQDGFDTRRLLDAASDVDDLRGSLSDDGLQPSAIRGRMFKLHELAVEVINDGAQDQAGELFELAPELDDEAPDILEAATRLHEALSALMEMRPASLEDDESREDEPETDDESWFRPDELITNNSTCRNPLISGFRRKRT